MMSKALEALKRLNNVVAYDENEELIPIDEDLSIIEKELKASEIIKKYGHFDFYTGELIVNIPNDKQEEFNLLKEVMS